MGEYAIRKSDRARIKIGTCEDMYYIRFEDRDKVLAEEGNVDLGDDREVAECRFRLPFPDEDSLEPGEYDDYNRYEKLFRGNEWFSDEKTADEPGTIQLSHREAGLLINVPCYHGEKLPDLGPNARVFWNGKGYHLVLSSVRAALIDGKLKLFPVVRCRFCNEAWRYEWDRILPYVHDPEMFCRLTKYAEV